MLGLEFIGVGACAWFASKYGVGKIKKSSKCIACAPKPAEEQFEFNDDLSVSSELVRRKLDEMSRLAVAEPREGVDETDEEELFGSGLWGVDFHTLRYEDEKVTEVSLYEELIKPRPIFPIVHPYVLVETASWIYVLEKWRDGVAVSRFKRKEHAIRSRGKWFGQGKTAVRRLPRLVQSTTDVHISMTKLLVWTMDHPDFKQYTDNCHTFAANLCKKCNMDNPYGGIEDILYEKY